MKPPPPKKNPNPKPPKPPVVHSSRCALHSFLTVCRANGFERVIFTPLPGSGASPRPLQLSHSKVPSWHQLRAVSFVLCNPFCPPPAPMPRRSFGKRQKEKKKNLTGFQRFSCLFSQASCYLNEGLSADWTSCVRLFKLTAPLSSPAMRKLWALRQATLSLARRWNRASVQVSPRRAGLLSPWLRCSWPWLRCPSAVCSCTSL